MTPEFCTSGAIRNTRPPAPPELVKLALPELTVPPVGLARVCPVERLKQAATDSAISLGLKSPRCLSLALELDMATPPIDFIPAANGKLILDLACRRDM